MCALRGKTPRTLSNVRGVLRRCVATKELYPLRRQSGCLFKRKRRDRFHAFFCFTALRTPPKRARGFKRENHFEHAVLKAAVSAVFFHGFGKEANFFKLVAGYIARRSFDKGRQTVDNGGAGMLNGGGLYNVIFNVGFAGKPPIAHIAVIGSVNLADGLFFNGDSLFGFNGNNGGHTDAAAGFDGGAEGFALNIVVNNIRNMLLVNGFNGEAEFVADSFAGVPCIGRLELFGVSNFASNSSAERSQP